MSPFFHTYEKMVAVAAWLRAQWVPILGAYVTFPTQVVLRMMPVADALNYDQKEEDILDKYEVSEEPHPDLEV